MLLTISLVFILSLLWGIWGFSVEKTPPRLRNAAKQFGGAMAVFGIIGTILYIAITTTTDPVATSVDIAFFAFLFIGLLVAALSSK